MNTKKSQKESGWKVYDFSIVGGVEIIAKNFKDAVDMAETAAVGAWRVEMEHETPLETSGVSMAARDEDKHVGIDWDNWDQLSHQAQRAIRNLVDKMAKAEGHRKEAISNTTYPIPSSEVN